MSKDNLNVTALVTVTLDLQLPDRWNADATAAQVHEQAVRSAKFLLEKLLEASARGELKVNDVKQHLRGKVVSIRPIMVMCGEDK